MMYSIRFDIVGQVQGDQPPCVRTRLALQLPPPPPPRRRTYAGGVGEDGAADEGVQQDPQQRVHRWPGRVEWGKRGRQEALARADRGRA